MVHIERMSSKGDGIARYTDIHNIRHTLYFPGACIGERVEFASLPSSKPCRIEDYTIISGSPERIRPPCPHADYCGGCTYQHISSAGQLYIKETFLNELFSDIYDAGKIPLRNTDAHYRYRNRVTLHFSNSLTGYFKKDGKTLYPFDGCLLLEDEIEKEAIKTAALTPVAGMYGVSIYRDSRDIVQRHYLQKPSDSAQFNQVNPKVNALLQAFVKKAASESGRTLSVLDLYCGNGNLSLPLRGIASRITGLDISRDSIHQAQEWIRSSGATNCEYIDIPVEKAHEQIVLFSESANMLILDPPRKGLGHEAEFLSRLGIPLVVYVSCNPVSLRKDISHFLESGYTLKKLEGFDMFPQTPHIETGAVLERGTDNF